MKYIDFSIERISAWATWTVVSCSSLLMMVQSNRFSVSYLVFTGLLFVLYLVLWNLISENDEKHVPSKGQLFTSILLYFVIIAIYFAAPVSFVAIFMLIFSAITPYYMSLKRAVMLSPILALPLVLVYHFYWQQESAFISGVLFWTFNIFALIMVNTSIRERDARLEAEMTSRNLEATQTLLNEAVKQSERVRITRNIHDLLGHHLTALAINLQVASHKSEGEVKESIEQCHQLAKLLLSDVREAVSDIRDKSKLDLEASIFSMLERLPKLKIDLQLDNSIQIDDIQMADAIIKTIQETITNTLKHAHGSEISVRLNYQGKPTSSEKHIEVVITNDGRMPTEIKLGNGLRGIKERLATLKGQASFIIEGGKFQTHLIIPVAQHD